MRVDDPARRRREVLWTVATTIVLIVRMLSSIGLVFLVIGWAVVAVRTSILNGFLIPAVICGAALLLSTYLYGWLRARYPRRSGS